MGDQPFGKCDYCRRERPLTIKYYTYDLKCDCHNGDHSERIEHCDECVPQPPPRIRVVYEAQNVKLKVKHHIVLPITES